MLNRHKAMLMKALEDKKINQGNKNLVASKYNAFKKLILEMVENIEESYLYEKSCMYTAIYTKEMKDRIGRNDDQNFVYFDLIDYHIEYLLFDLKKWFDNYE
jgi:hypothetical protein